jgi:hypothetical protein
MGSSETVLLCARRTYWPGDTQGRLATLGLQLAPDETLAEWDDAAFTHLSWNTERRALRCLPGGTAGTLHGTGVYTTISSVCTAAVHAGAITLESGGRFEIEPVRGRQRFRGSTRHGVTSQRWNPLPNGGFRIVGPEVSSRRP